MLQMYVYEMFIISEKKQNPNEYVEYSNFVN